MQRQSSEPPSYGRRRKPRPGPSARHAGAGEENGSGGPHRRRSSRPRGPRARSPTQKATAKTKRLNSCEQSKWLRCERSGVGAASGIRSSGRHMATPIKTPDQASRVGKRRTSDGAEPRTVGPSSRTPGPSPAAVEGGEDDGSPKDRKKIAVNTAEDPGAPVRLRVTRSRRNTINAPSSRRLFEENT